MGFRLRVGWPLEEYGLDRPTGPIPAGNPAPKHALVSCLLNLELASIANSICVEEANSVMMSHPEFLHGISLKSTGL